MHLIFSADSNYLLTDTRARALCVYAINQSSPAALEPAVPRAGGVLRAAYDNGLLELVSHMRAHIAELPEATEKIRLQPALGGKRGAFAATGTPRGALRIWHWLTEELVADVSSGAHSGAANCVSWSPVDPQLMVSASDDMSVRVWTPPPPEEAAEAAHQASASGADEHGS